MNLLRGNVSINTVLQSKNQN